MGLWGSEVQILSPRPIEAVVATGGPSLACPYGSRGRASTVPSTRRPAFLPLHALRRRAHPFQARTLPTRAYLLWPPSPRRRGAGGEVLHFATLLYDGSIQLPWPRVSLEVIAGAPTPNGARIGTEIAALKSPTVDADPRANHYRPRRRHDAAA